MIPTMPTWPLSMNFQIRTATMVGSRYGNRTTPRAIVRNFRVWCSTSAVISPTTISSATEPTVQTTVFWNAFPSSG